MKIYVSNIPLKCHELGLIMIKHLVINTFTDIKRQAEHLYVYVGLNGKFLTHYMNNRK